MLTHDTTVGLTVAQCNVDHALENLSSLNLFARDIQHAVGRISTYFLIVSPVF